jgi:purine-binding chemotaxis protein CheW
MEAVEHTGPNQAALNSAVMQDIEHTGETQQFISFRIGEEEYAIDIMSVREIKGWTHATTLPNQPEYIRGVLNLRGTIVPIFDLRCKFNMGLTDATESHVVIIVSVQERTIGLLVDAVSDILTVTQEEIKDVPTMERGADADFLTGLISVKDSMVALLCLARLFDSDVLATAEEAAAPSA